MGDGDRRVVLRAPMHSRDDDVDPRLAPERALALGVCGMGGRLPRPPASLDDALEAMAHHHDERTAARLRRLAEVPDGAEVWTRLDELFHRGVLTGPWGYDADDEAIAADLVHVRPTRWDDGPVDPPSAVLASFARGGRNLQRVRDA